MAQNRNKLIDLFIGNMANSIVHEILEKAIDDKKIASRYERELTTSLEIAKKYREKINPVNNRLSDTDIGYIKSRMINKVKSELLIRISRGYENINLDLVGELVNKALTDTNIA